jgi:D-alanine-D-alanine ligase
MRIGLTYDLKSDYLAQGMSPEDAAEFDSLETVQAIEAALARLGHRTERIGAFAALVGRLAAGARWDLVFNICEGVHGLAREAQVPATLEAFAIPCTFSDAATLALCLHKGHTKAVLKAAGVPTTDFAVARAAAEAAPPPFGPPFFVKPVAEGTGKGVSANSIVRRERDLPEACAKLLARHGQPVLIEPYLPGREFTVGLTGEGAGANAEGCMEIRLRNTAEPGVYSYTNKAEYRTRVDYVLSDDAQAREAMAVALAGWRALGCRDAGRADLRADAAGRVMLMEVNPLAGLNPADSDLPILWRMTGRSYDDLIATIVREACGRVRGAGR